MSPIAADPARQFLIDRAKGTNEPTSELYEVPLAEDGVGSFAYWKGEVKAARDFVEQVKTTRKWDQNLKAWSSALPRNGQEVIVPKDFTLTQQKSAMLFFQVPDVQLQPKNPQFAAAVPTFQAVINHYLGPQGVDAAALIDQIIPDVIMVAGIGWSKIGYEAIADGEIDIPRIDPATQQPQIGPDGNPIADTAPNIISERYFWEHIPPGRGLCPTTHVGPWDKAPWLGFWFDGDVAQLEAQLGISIPKHGDAAEGLLAGDVDLQQTARSRKRDHARGYEIWYRASDIDPTAKNPDLYRQLIWFEGQDEPAVHRNSPYQRFDERGRFQVGMKGNPIHPLTIRDMPDHPYPPSDATITRGLVDELSLGRTQMIQQRKRSMPLRIADGGRMPKETLDKIANAEFQEVIVTDGWDKGNEPIAELSRAQFPRENFTFNDYIDRDISEAWSLGSPQLGSEAQGTRTATELSMMAQATNVRMDKERARVLRWVVSGAEKLASLIQIFADQEDYVQITDQQGQQSLQVWDKTKIQGAFVFTAKANSQLKLDAARDMQQSVDVYTLMRQDARVKPEALIAQVARTHNMNPTELVAPPPPPEPPEPPKVSVAVKGEDLIPFAPQYPNVIAMLQAQGVGGMAPPAQTTDPAQGMQPHGGPQPPQQPINQHTADHTGQLPGGGSATQAVS